MYIKNPCVQGNKTSTMDTPACALGDGEVGRPAVEIPLALVQEIENAVDANPELTKADLAIVLDHSVKLLKRLKEESCVSVEARRAAENRHPEIELVPETGGGQFIPPEILKKGKVKKSKRNLLARSISTIAGLPLWVLKSYVNVQLKTCFRGFGKMSDKYLESIGPMAFTHLFMNKELVLCVGFNMGVAFCWWSTVDERGVLNPILDMSKELSKRLWNDLAPARTYLADKIAALLMQHPLFAKFITFRSNVEGLSVQIDKLMRLLMDSGVADVAETLMNTGKDVLNTAKIFTNETLEKGAAALMDAADYAAPHIGYLLNVAKSAGHATIGYMVNASQQAEGLRALANASEGNVLPIAMDVFSNQALTRSMSGAPIDDFIASVVLLIVEGVPEVTLRFKNEELSLMDLHGTSAEKKAPALKILDDVYMKKAKDLFQDLEKDYPGVYTLVCERDQEIYDRILEVHAKLPNSLYGGRRKKFIASSILRMLSLSFIRDQCLVALGPHSIVRM